jgi:hypothetical protein
MTQTSAMCFKRKIVQTSFFCVGLSLIKLTYKDVIAVKDPKFDGNAPDKFVF